jgi:hypothetical protein
LRTKHTRRTIFSEQRISDIGRCHNFGQQWMNYTR